MDEALNSSGATYRGWRPVASAIILERSRRLILMSTEPASCAPVLFEELLSAYEFVDSAGCENEAYLDPRNARIFWVSDLVDTGEEDIPEDLDTSEIYIAIPDKFELDLGRPVVDAFVEEVLPEDWDRVRDLFRGKGAYGRFKQFLHDRGALERWYAFEAAATEQALRDWCEANNIPLTSR
jgi:hypothetical protein